MNVIPQIFYDLIARIVPTIGVLFFISVTYILSSQSDLTSMTSFLKGDSFDINRYLNFWVVLAILTISYLLSLILKIPSEWISDLKFLKRIFFIKEKTIDGDRYLAEKEKLKDNFVPEPWNMFSLVRVKLPEEGYRLLKMLAEIRLCEILFTGFIFLIILNIILMFFSEGFHLFRLGLILFFLISSRSLLQLKFSIRNSFEKGVLMTWKTLIGKNNPIDSIGGKINES